LGQDDLSQLAHAVSLGRCLVTHNRVHFLMFIKIPSSAGYNQSMDKQTLDQARQYHTQRELYRQLAREQRRQERYRQIGAAIQRLAPDYPALRAVYLFGSLVQPGRYGLRSDIDVAVVCDNPTEESRFWQALERELKCDIDLRPYRGAVAWAVNTCGECIYERKISGVGT
jgi:predicted nucleotidyltransferase